MGDGYRAIPVTLPEGAAVHFGELYTHDDPAWLDEDMLAIRLGDGSFLDVGWRPSGDPDGAYFVVHFNERDGFAAGVEVLVSRDVREVAAAITGFRTAPHRPASGPPA